MTVTTIGSGITGHNVILNTGDVLNVQSGGTADNTTVNKGGNDNVLLGGIANDTVVNLGGVETVDGAVVNTIVNDGGTESLDSGGSATGTVVTGGGLQLVHTGGVAKNTTVNNAGNQSVDGTTFNTTVNSGGTESLFNSSVANGSVVNNGGSEFVHAGSTTKGVTINAGGAVFLANGAIASGGITFSGANAKLDISGTTMPATSITGFAVTDEIDLGGLVYAVSDTVSVSGDVVTVTGAGGASETLTIVGAQHDVFKLSLEPDGDNGTKLSIASAVGNPVVSSPSVAVNGNAAATAIGIAAPTDPNYAAAQLTIIVHSLPDDGGVLLADGVTKVVAGQSLTITQLTGLLFAPTHGQFNTSSAFTYTVTDPAGNSSNGAATLAINPAVGNPVVPSVTLTVVENAAATAIGLSAPSDPNYANAQLAIAVTTLPTDGSVTLADGITAVTVGEALTDAQLTGLLFKPTHGLFGATSTFGYKVTDPSGNTATGATTLAIGPAVGNPVVSSPTITVAENSAGAAIGIAAPTDPNYAPAQLTITVGNMPGDGAVTLADGVTAVTTGEALTVAQLTSLLFTPTHGRFTASSAFTYSVADPSGNASNGAATLAIGPALGSPVVSSPALTVAENATGIAMGIAAPIDPNYAAAQLTITVGTLPSDGVVTLADDVTAVTAGQVLSSAQLSGLLFTPTPNQFGATSAFTYTVADPAGNSSVGTVTLAIGPALGNPVVSSPALTVAENAAATAIGIAAPTDPNYAASQLTITAGTLPSDGVVTLADGVTAVTAGQALTGLQLSGLLFTPTSMQFGATSAFTYTVADPAGNSSVGTATLAIGPGVGNPVVSSPALTVAENAAATAMGIAAPTDPNYAASQLTITVGTLPSDGNVTLADGATAVTAGQALTSVQLSGLLFTPTPRQFGAASAFTYTVADPAGNSSVGTVTLAIGPAIGNPVVSSAALTVAENAAATAIGIAAPTDPNYAGAQLTITAGALPGDGAVTLADGATAVTTGQNLTTDQLTGLLFTPATGQSATNSAFTYSVTDPAGNTSIGTAALGIGPATPIGNGFINIAAASSIDASMANAEMMREWAHYALYIAPVVTNDGANVSTASLDGNGDVAVYSTADGAGHVLSASGTGRSIIAAGSGHDTVTLSNGTDLLATGVGANTVNLQSGDNQLRSEGNDTINAGVGSDQIEIGGSSVINGGAARLYVTLDAGATLALHTGTASVEVRGGYGGGAFSGGTDGHNLLIAGTGATTLYAGGDGDILVGSGGTGTTMNGWGGHEVMTGQYSQGNDVFNANGADVFMVGGAGTNVFNVGAGHADIVAEFGTDLFNFTKGNANTTYIAGFKVGTDAVHLSGFGADEVSHALGNASYYQGSEILTLRDGTNITFGHVTGLNQSSFT